MAVAHVSLRASALVFGPGLRQVLLSFAEVPRWHGACWPSGVIVWDQGVCYVPTMSRRLHGGAIVLALVLVAVCAAGLAPGRSTGSDGCGLTSTASGVYGAASLNDIPVAFEALPPTELSRRAAWVGVAGKALTLIRSPIVTLPEFRAPPVVRRPSA